MAWLLMETIELEKRYEDIVMSLCVIEIKYVLISFIVCMRINAYTGMQDFKVVASSNGMVLDGGSNCKI